MFKQGTVSKSSSNRKYLKKALCEKGKVDQTADIHHTYEIKEYICDTHGY